MELEREKALLEEQQRKTQELKDRLTPENIKSKEKNRIRLARGKDYGKGCSIRIL